MNKEKKFILKRNDFNGNHKLIATSLHKNTKSSIEIANKKYERNKLSSKTLSN